MATERLTFYRCHACKKAHTERKLWFGRRHTPIVEKVFVRDKRGSVYCPACNARVETNHIRNGDAEYREWSHEITDGLLVCWAERKA